MNIEQLYTFCLEMKGVTESFPFDNDTLVFKVAGKMFCLTSLKNWEGGEPTLNLKCQPEKSVILRQDYEGIVPGFHMNKKHWNTVYTTKDVDEELLKELIKHSYTEVIKSLPKKIQGTL